MKTHTHTAPSHPTAPCTDKIRDYAFHLYEQSGCVQGRDLDNWLEASACLHAHPTSPASVAFAPVDEPAYGPAGKGHVPATTGHIHNVVKANAHAHGLRHT